MSIALLFRSLVLLGLTDRGLSKLITTRRAAEEKSDVRQKPSVERRDDAAEKLRRKAIVGSSEQVAARLKELAKGLELDELVVVTWIYDPAPRHRSYELLAQAFGLGKPEARYVIDIRSAGARNRCPRKEKGRIQSRQ